MKKGFLTAMSVLIAGCCFTPLFADMIDVVGRQDSRVMNYGYSRLKEALATQGHTLQNHSYETDISGQIAVLDRREDAESVGLIGALANNPGPEGYSILRMHWRGKSTLVLAGGDERGAMYGLLDLAEQIGFGKTLDAIVERTERPRVAFRAIKFNLPWFSYRAAESLQLHMETVRDLDYWKGFLDMMAQNRFNRLTLWNLHPFTFMVRPTHFPEACPFDDKQLADWQNFYRSLFRMAADRGIESYIVNWNIFVSPEFSEAYGAAEYCRDWLHLYRYWIGPSDKENNELIERYTRQVVTQVINEYPDLTGIGITLGERMGDMTPQERREWIDRTILAGIRDADRKVKLIYRAPLSAGTGSGGSVDRTTELLTREALEKIDYVYEPIWTEFKYNWSHGHSSPKLFQVHGGPLTDAYWNPSPKNYRVVWTVRNEDFFVLRWGNQEFIREFISNNVEDYVGGVIVGSECYIPAKDYITRPGPHKNWDYAWQRQWLFYLMWGRLLYNPNTPDSLFEAHLADRFGKDISTDLLRSWTLASKSANRFATLIRGTWDKSIYTEGFAGYPDAQFIDIHRFSTSQPLDPAYMSIQEFVQAGKKAPQGRISPLQLADETERDCRRALELIAKIEAANKRQGRVNPTLDCELSDIRSWSLYGLYFAEKIRGGVALAEFQRDGNQESKNSAVNILTRAASLWEQLADSITKYNKEQIPYDREQVPSVNQELFSWKRNISEALQDIEIAREAKVSK